MVQKADYYEALTWHALEQIHGADNVRYEPAREMHTCAGHCRFAMRCAKPSAHSRLIHTVPDFFVTRGRPLFVHVFYSDSKETSHAKFWRTVSEIAELKCFVPGCRCQCVIFETTAYRGRYLGEGWYPEFLKALHCLADRVFFFSAPTLGDDLRRLGDRLSEFSGTAAVHREIGEHPADYPTVQLLIDALRKSRHPLSAIRSATAQMWEQERQFCSKIDPFVPREHTGERLRNALLQTVLIMSLFDWPASVALDRIRTLSQIGRERFPERNRVIDWMCRVPISRRGGAYRFLAEKPGQPIGQPMQCEPSEDLRWLTRALARNEFPTSRPILEAGLAKIVAEFLASSQAREAVACLQTVLAQPPNSHQRIPKDWQIAFDRVASDQQYNPIAELLIEAIGLGTYPLIRAYNDRFPNEPINRPTLRGLYGNQRSRTSTEARRRIIGRLATLLPERVDWQDVSTAYLMRKAKRLTGPQSAVKPLEILVREILADQSLPAGFSLVENRILATFAADLVKSRQLGTWRVSLALQSASEIIPLFISAMRDSQDCAHKVREFAGHLRLARHRWDGKRRRSTKVKRGIAILEGGYSEDDKRALYLAGYVIASLDSLPGIIAGLGPLERVPG